MTRLSQQSAAQAMVPTEFPLAEADTISPQPSPQPTHHLQYIVGTTQGLLFLDGEHHVEREGSVITALAPSPDGLWVITDGNAVWHRDLNHQWHQVTQVDDAQLHCLLPLADGVLVGASGACLMRITDGQGTWLNCFETVAGREEWYTPWGDPPDVRSLTLGPSGDLYVNVHVGGILHSADQGQSWQPTIDFQADVHEVRTVPDRPDWVLAATAQGLAISEDRGYSWRFDRAHLHAAYARAIAVCGETILMSASTGPRPLRAALYRRPLGQSGQFEKCEQGLPEWFPSNIDTGTLATLGQCVAFGTHEGDLFVSQDAGLTWQAIATGLAAIQCLSLVGERR